MYEDDVELTAYRQDEEPRRLDRLNRVLGYACAMSGKRGSGKPLGKLAGLHDHNGTLTVRWKSRPTEEEKQVLVAAWGSVIGDSSEIVEHEVVRPASRVAFPRLAHGTNQALQAAH